MFCPSTNPDVPADRARPSQPDGAGNEVCAQVRPPSADRQSVSIDPVLPPDTAPYARARTVLPLATTSVRERLSAEIDTPRLPVKRSHLVPSPESQTTGR